MAETNIKNVNLKIGTENQFQSKLKDLPLNTLVGTTDPIQEGELDTSIINKLNKADNSLPKPTNDTTGSAGQVLKKTANGSEWGDAPSGGGKLYQHLFEFAETDNDAHFAIFQVLSYRSTPYGETELYDYLMRHKTSLVGYKYKSLTYSNPVVGYQLFNELELTESGSYPYPYTLKKVCYYELNADGSVKRTELVNPKFVGDEATEL